MSKREDFLRSLFSAVYHLDNAPDLTCNKFHKLIYDALAEEFERGRQSVKVEVETYLASECAHRTRPTGGFYGGEHYGPPEGEEAYDIIDGVRAVLTGSSK